MSQTTHFLAIDPGATIGRVMGGRWNGDRSALQEPHRFPNDPVTVLGHLHWDAPRLRQAIKTSIARYAAQDDVPLPGIGADTGAYVAEYTTATTTQACGARAAPGPNSGGLDDFT